MHFKQRAKTILANGQFRSGFQKATDYLAAKYDAAFDDRERLAKLRQRGSEIRADAVARLPELLEQLEARLSEQGIQVHWAEDSAQATGIIHQLLERRGVTEVVKGKSMATEEIELNHFLADRGIECLETDMGEWIVQLAGEMPSHIIIPAIHKTKEEISALLHDKVPDTPYTDDVDELIQIGRTALRERFARAGAGISGVNMAVAETGTLLLVENEGNGRMCTTVPPMHIAVMGIEKVVPSFEVVPTLLELLTRSATGQSITTYINMISGPRQPGEPDGPEEVHLVLLDNGRARIHQHDKMRPTLHCIRCGACMNHCPVYARIGGHAYGSPYPGPIGQVLVPQLEGLETQGELVQACSLNGACGEACPVDIPLQDIIRQLRAEAVGGSGDAQQVLGHGSRRRLGEVIMWRLWRFAHGGPRRYRMTTWLATRLRRFIPKAPKGWSQSRTSPVPAPRSLHERMGEEERDV